MTEQADRSLYGAFDLAGNAWEWTKDWYDPKYYQLFRTTPAENPAGPSEPRSKQLVVKGARRGMVTSRKGERFDVRLPYLGFRCVLPVEGPDNAFEAPPAATPGARPRPAIAVAEADRSCRSDRIGTAAGLTPPARGPRP